MPIGFGHGHAIAFGRIRQKFRSEVRVPRLLMQKRQFAIMLGILGTRRTAQLSASDLFGDWRFFNLVVQQPNPLPRNREAHGKILAGETEQRQELFLVELSGAQRRRCDEKDKNESNGCHVIQSLFSAALLLRSTRLWPSPQTEGR